MKLVLTSFWTTPSQDQEIAALVGKPLADISVAYIENAHDVYDDPSSLEEGRDVIRGKGFDVEVIDLRDGLTDRADLHARLSSVDVLWFSGGNPFYLRWLMRATGTDDLIVDLVTRGTVYVEASAAAVVAGPTLRSFDNQDDPAAAPVTIWEGLGLIDTVLVPHVDNAEFGEGCRQAGEELAAAGYATQWITDSQAWIIDGNRRLLL